MSFSISAIAKTSAMMASTAQAAHQKAGSSSSKSNNPGSSVFSPKQMATDTVRQGVGVVLDGTKKSNLGLDSTATKALFTLGFMTAQKQSGLGASQSGFIIDLKV